MVREGSIRRDLAEIAKIKDTGIDLRRLILSTDGVEPRDLIEKGYMEFVLRKAIDYGFDPVAAIQMATLNVAEHFSLDGLIGGIAPGRYADLGDNPGRSNHRSTDGYQQRQSRRRKRHTPDRPPPTHLHKTEH